MATPEGRVKGNVKRILNKFKVHYDMPVNHGFGKRGVDFHCAVRGPHGAIAFYIETKEPGKHPTALQWEFLHNRRDEQGAMCFVIDGQEGLDQLTWWLQQNEKAVHEYSRPSKDRVHVSG